jgi:hypothetical protein
MFKILKILGEKPFIFLLQCLDFVDKIRKIVGIKEEKMGHEKIIVFIL